MHSFKQYFTEANINYTPPSRKDYLLFDFYMMEWLVSNINPEGVGDRYSASGDPTNVRMVRPVNISTWQSLLDAKDQIINETREKMLVAVLYAILCEARHWKEMAYNNGQSGSVPLNIWLPKTEYLNKIVGPGIVPASQLGPEPELGGKINISPEGRREVVADTYNSNRIRVWRRFIGANIPQEEWPYIVKEAYHLYNDFQWETNYGGPAWAQICKAWLKLYRAKTDQEKMIYIDHMYDIQHNNNTVLDKVTEWYNGAGLSWLSIALDFKRDIKEPSDLLPQVSPQMKRIAQRILASQGYSSHPTRIVEPGNLFEFLQKNEGVYRIYPESIRKNKVYVVLYDPLFLLRFNYAFAKSPENFWAVQFIGVEPEREAKWASMPYDINKPTIWKLFHDGLEYKTEEELNEYVFKPRGTTYAAFNKYSQFALKFASLMSTFLDERPGGSWEFAKVVDPKKGGYLEYFTFQDIESDLEHIKSNLYENIRRFGLFGGIPLQKFPWYISRELLHIMDVKNTSETMRDIYSQTLRSLNTSPSLSSVQI